MLDTSWYCPTRPASRVGRGVHLARHVGAGVDDGVPACRRPAPRGRRRGRRRGARPAGTAPARCGRGAAASRAWPRASACSARWRPRKRVPPRIEQLHGPASGARRRPGADRLAPAPQAGQAQAAVELLRAAVPAAPRRASMPVQGQGPGPAAPQWKAPPQRGQRSAAVAVACSSRDEQPAVLRRAAGSSAPCPWCCAAARAPRTPAWAP